MNTPTEIGMRAAKGSMTFNVFMAIAKIIAGWLGRSYALIADGMESTVDIFSSALIYNGLRLSQEPADKDHPYGHGRAETIAAAAGALILIGGAVMIGVNSANSLFVKRESPNAWTLVILLLIVAFKEIAFRYLRRIGKQTGSQAVTVEAWHHRSDMYTSLAAGVGIAIAVTTGWNQADSIAAILASLWMGWNGLQLLRPAVDEIMETSTDPEIIARIRLICLNCPGVLGVDKVLVRKMGLQFMVDLHLEVDPKQTVSEGHKIAHMAKDRIKTEIVTISDVLIHVEPYPHTIHDAKTTSYLHDQSTS